MIPVLMEANEMSQIHDNIISSYQVDFENDMKNSIIFDVGEYSLNSFYEANYELIEKRKSYGWPIAAYDTKSDLINYLQLNQYKAFQICSSLGLCGWVLAKQLDILTVE